MEFLCGLYISVKFENILFTLFGIELKINVAITIRFCLLNDTSFLYSNELSTLMVNISLFSKICFG